MVVGAGVEPATTPSPVSSLLDKAQRRTASLRLSRRRGVDASFEQGLPYSSRTLMEAMSRASTVQNPSPWVARQPSAAGHGH